MMIVRVGVTTGGGVITGAGPGAGAVVAESLQPATRLPAVSSATHA